MIEQVYVAHPLSGNVTANTASVRRWLRLLIDMESDYAFLCPWLPYVDVLDDDNPAHRARGLRDCLAFAAKAHGIVLCGPRISSGMQMEIEAVRAHGGWVADLTGRAVDSFDVGSRPLGIGAIRWLEREDRSWSVAL